MFEMHPNLDFLLAGLILLCFDLVHFLCQRKLKESNTSLFFLILITGIASLFLGIVRNTAMNYGGPLSCQIAKGSMTLVLFTQILLHYEFFCFSEKLRGCPQKKLYHILLPAGVLAIMGTILILLDFRVGRFFIISREGSIIHGPYYKHFYNCLLLFDIITITRCICHRKELGRRSSMAILELTGVVFTCIFLHIYAGICMMTWYGTALGITVFYLSFNNPHSYMDALTQVFNYKYFEQWIKEQLENRTPLYILVIELDQLKHIRKLYGTDVNNEVLNRVGSALWNLSPDHKVFRTAVERFTVCTDTQDSYDKLKSCILTYFDQYLIFNGAQLHVSAILCGITSAEDLQLQTRMYAYIEYLLTLAADQRSHQFIQHSNETWRHFEYEETVERFLDKSIEEDLFEVWYQPIYSLENERFVTMEALSRLRHPQLGMVPPDIFISIAERNGVISQLGHLQFQRICRFLQSHSNIMQNIQNVKINLSPRELLEPGYCASLVKTIHICGLPYSWFQFEITETIATEYTEEVQQAIDIFSAVGISLSLDDFGSGYANLNTILSMPFSVVKLDRSLLRGICENEKAAFFYRNIVVSLQNVGYQVVAEGVEKQEEVRLLKKWGVNMVQGYYYSRPVTPEMIETIL